MTINTSIHSVVLCARLGRGRAAHAGVACQAEGLDCKLGALRDHEDHASF